MNRIEERFARLRREGRKGFIVYIGAGDPDLAATQALAAAFDRIGVDILELGVPFSDPLADGVVNQLAAQRGLESGTTPARVLETVAAIRRDCQLPIVLYLYYNLIHRRGLERFVREAAAAGVDGVLALDLPPEEIGEYRQHMAAAGLCPIVLVAPTTPESRIGVIVREGRGFVYYVSREGVTGMQATVAANLAEMTGRIRRQTDLPIAVGFGISTPEQARLAAGCADAVVVGSAVVDRIARCGRSPDLVPQVTAFTQTLVAAVQQAGGSASDTPRS